MTVLVVALYIEDSSNKRSEHHVIQNCDNFRKPNIIAASYLSKRYGCCRIHPRFYLSFDGSVKPFAKTKNGGKVMTEKIRLTLKNKKGSWYKTISHVDRSKGKNGYALQGEFIPQDVQQEYDPWEILVKNHPRGKKPEYHVTYVTWLKEKDFWSEPYDRSDFLDFLDLVEDFVQGNPPIFPENEDGEETETESEKEKLARLIREEGGQVTNEQVSNALAKLNS